MASASAAACSSTTSPAKATSAPPTSQSRGQDQAVQLLVQLGARQPDLATHQVAQVRGQAADDLGQAVAALRAPAHGLSPG